MCPCRAHERWRLWVVWNSARLPRKSGRISTLRARWTHDRNVSPIASMTAPTFRVIAIELYERPVALRIPFRFGAATVTHAPQAFVRARIRLSDNASTGIEAHSGAAEVM